MMSFSRWSERAGSWDTSQEQRQRRQRAWPDSQEGLEEEHPALLERLRSDDRTARGLLFGGAVNRLTCPLSPSGHGDRTGQDEESEQRTWSPHRRGLSGGGTGSQNITVRGTLERICPGPSCHRAGGPPAGDLSWVAQGRAAPGTRAPRSQPSASPLQALPPAPHPVPVLPTGSPPSTAVSSPGSEQLLEAHPPTFLSWERGSKNLEAVSRAGTSGQWRVKQQSSHKRREPGREEAQPAGYRKESPRSWFWAAVVVKTEEDLLRKRRKAARALSFKKDLILQKEIKPERMWL